MIEGRLVRGLGKAAAFTQLDWVRRRFIDAAGIDPHPGTVNLDVLHEYQLSWKDWCALPGEAMHSEDAAFCSADRVTMAGSMIPAAARSTISPFEASRPWPFFALRTSLTTTEPSRPELSAI